MVNAKVEKNKLVQIINLDEVEFNNYRSIDPKRVDALVGSILKVNVLEPIHLLRVKDGGKKFKFYIIAGHHRFAAVKKIREEYPHLGEFPLPALIQDGNLDELNSKNVMTQSVVTNEAREESNIVDRARGYALLRESGMSVREICDVVGKSRRMVEKTLKVDLLSDEMKDYIVQNVDVVRESVVLGVAARCGRGDKVSIDDLNKKTTKQRSEKTQPNLNFDHLRSVLAKHKITMSKIDLILKDLR